MATTFLPFLYRTRTLQSLPRNSVTPRFLRSLLHTTARGRARDHIPFELPPDISSELLPDKPEDSSNKATITPSERLIFDRIFEEIASRGPLSGHGTSKPRPGVRERRDTPPLKSAHMPSGRDSINILSSTAKEITGHPRPTAGLDSLHPLGSISTAKNPQEALLRFPPSLRRAAQLALGIIEPSGQEQERLGDLGGKDTGDPGSASATNADDNSVTEQNRNRTQHSQEESHGRTVDEEALGRQLEWESLRREFQQEIEARMDQCESDTALWDVLETEVFPLVGKLGLGADSRAKSRRRKRISELETGAIEASLDLHVHGPCYPALLLHALRRLDSASANPSPLALALLPRIKDLGLGSYILGVSTHFYNTLMSIYWYRYNDANAVLDLLEEMRHAGLYFDEDSKKLVNIISHQLGSYAAGEKGAFLQALVALPEFDNVLHSRLRHWKRNVEYSIQERLSDHYSFD